MKIDQNKALFSSSEVADMLKVSRITVFRYIKSGRIKADKVGKTYLISRESLTDFLNVGKLTEGRKKEIEQDVERVIKEYGEALKKLGRE